MAMTSQPDLWPTAAAGATANVEFVSTTPNGPPGFQDALAGITGDALAGVLTACGWQVTREFYVNDVGAPVTALARSLYALLYQSAEGTDLPPLDPFMTALLADAKGDTADLIRLPETTWRPALEQRVVAFALARFRALFDQHRITIDRYTHESTLTGEGQRRDMLANLRSRGLLTETRQDPGAEPLLCLATRRFGDSEDRALCRGDSTGPAPDAGWTYFMGDVLYHADKLARGYDRLLTVFRADHAAYGPRIPAAIAALAAPGQKVEADVCVLDPVAPELLGAEGRVVLAFYPPRVLRWLLLTRTPGKTLDLRADAACRDRAEADLAALDALCAEPTTKATPDQQSLLARGPELAAQTERDGDVTRLGRHLCALTKAGAATRQTRALGTALGLLPPA